MGKDRQTGSHGRRFESIATRLSGKIGKSDVGDVEATSLTKFRPIAGVR